VRDDVAARLAEAGESGDEPLPQDWGLFRPFWKPKLPGNMVQGANSGYGGNNLFLRSDVDPASRFNFA
jgi:hypothetical protein